MKRPDLEARVVEAFQYELDTLISFLDLEHGDAREFKSVRGSIVLRHPNTGEDIETLRWVDPPEKKAYLEALKNTLKNFVRPGAESNARQLFDPIIAAYYTTSRAKTPIAGKVKETVKS